MNYAQYYDKLIGLIKTGGVENLNRIKFYTQFLTYEYCKAANNDARAVTEALKESSVRLFEIKWLLGVF